MSKYLSTSLITLAACSLMGCQPKSVDVPVNIEKAPEPAKAVQVLSAQDSFWGGLSLHCGKSYGGKLVSTDAVDEDMTDKPMFMTVNCSDTEIRIPFAVGDNKSRTWVFSKTDTGLHLAHQHNHEDGSEDTLSGYGGDTAQSGTAARQEFPADGFSMALFLLQDLEASMNNIWAVEVTPDMYAYELNREGRHFRVEFDLNQEIETPVIPW